MKLVLLPGLDGTGVLFRPLLAALPPELEPVVVTYPTRDPLGYEQLLPLVSEALPKESPYVLLGESFGGPLALQIAAARPKNLRGLILCGSFVTCPAGNVPVWLSDAVLPIHFHAFPIALWLRRTLGLYETKEHADLGEEAITQVAPAVFAQRVREIIRVDVSEQLQGCEVPTLYIQGTRDRIVKASNLSRIQRLKPSIRVAQIDCGHMILKTRPTQSAHVITEFAKSLLES